MIIIYFNSLHVYQITATATHHPQLNDPTLYSRYHRALLIHVFTIYKIQPSAPPFSGSPLSFGDLRALSLLLLNFKNVS